MEESIDCPNWVGNFEDLEKWLSGYEMNHFDPGNAVINRLSPVEPQDVFSRSISEFSAILNPKGQATANITFEYIVNDPSEINTFYKDAEKRKTSFISKTFKKEIILVNSGEEEFTPRDGKVKLILKFKSENGKLTLVVKNLTEVSEYKKDEYFDMRIFELVNTAYNLKINIIAKEGFSTLPSKLTDISYHAKTEVFCKPYNTGYIRKSKEEIQLSSLQINIESRYVPWILNANQIHFANICSTVSDNIALNGIQQVLEELDKHIANVKLHYKEIAKSQYQDEYESDVKLINDEISLAKTGMKILKEDSDALWSFKFLNNVMSEKYPDGKWWPFQLIFILIMISKYFDNRNKKTVALLNFPTGMGKTEAFMGYALWLSVYLRKKGKNFGNVAIIKYPRVMLSKQQASRAIDLFSYANKCLLKTELPKYPFSIGVLYSKGDTPNKIMSDDSPGFSSEFLELENAFRGKGKPGFAVDKCPSCKNKITTTASRERGRILYICNTEGCPISSESWSSVFYREKGEIPLYITDDEVFRYVPTVILTTTYKFASFCTSGRWKTLLGENSQLKSDTKFGYYFYEKDEEEVKNFNKINKTESWFSGKKINLKTSPPSLIIIDETHLITGSQASLLGPVETAFLDIFKYNDKYPQIISSSATINKTLINPKERSFQQHMAQLFGTALENIMLFPSSLDVYEDAKFRKQRVIASFYPSQYSQLFGLEKVSSFLFSKVSAETDFNYRVPVFYFSSKSEMSQARKALEDRVSGVIKFPFNDRFKVFSGDMDTGLLYSQLDEITDNVANKKNWSAILATNTIANGIDSDILNIMVFNGLPKSISEYVQARSRTARKRTNNALVILILSRTNPREKAFHESFYEWHTNQAFLYDESPVNKYSEGVIDETIPRLFHLYAFWNKDGSKKTEMIYKKEAMKVLISEVLSNNQNNATDKIAEWIVSPVDRARMNAEIKNKILKYLRDYDNILNSRRDPTIYDFVPNPPVPNKCLPKISLLQVSDMIDIMLSFQSINTFEQTITR